MNVFVFAGILGISMVVTTLLISGVMLTLSRAVTNNNMEIEASKTRYKQNMTKGHKIAVTADKETQIKDAQREAARRAAALPRGANMNIGRLGEETLKTATQNVDNDPLTAVKIAQFQGWQGLGEFNKVRDSAAAAPTAKGGAQAGPQVKRKLVAGKDYPVVEITASMDPAEKRRARIANAKAKSAAYKALKESGQDMVAAAPSPASASQPAAAKPSAAEAAASAGIEPPQLIEITDDMDPADVRKARIANAKAQSAYKKALKAAGIDPSDSDSAEPEAAPQPAASAPEPQKTTAVDNDVPRPDLIEITDDMDPNDLRKARIANAKAVSAYKKALKAAGIDPSTVDI